MVDTLDSKSGASGVEVRFLSKARQSIRINIDEIDFDRLQREVSSIRCDRMPLLLCIGAGRGPKLLISSEPQAFVRACFLQRPHWAGPLYHYRSHLTMEVNILAFIATALFILIPTAFLLILYVQTASQEG